MEKGIIHGEQNSIGDRLLMDFLLVSGSRVGEVYKIDSEEVDLE